MDKIKVAVTGINAGDNPAPGLGVAKSLKQDPGLECRIIGLACDALDPGIYVDGLVDRAYLIPYPGGDCAGMLARLLYVHEREGLDVVVPTLDSELPFFITHRELLAGHGIHCLVPDWEQLGLRSKPRLAEAAAAAGVATPRQCLVRTEAELDAAVRAIGLPVMIKGAMYNALHAATPAAAREHFRTLAARWSTPLICQAVVRGEGLNVAGVGDGNGGVLGLVAVRKMTVTGLGKIWTGVTIAHAGLLAATRAFVAHARWRGAFEMECIVDGDQVHLIEINPRFPAWIYLSAAVGTNLPAMLVRSALERSVEPAPPCPAGRLYVRYTEDRVFDMAVLQQLITRGETR